VVTLTLKSAELYTFYASNTNKKMFFLRERKIFCLCAYVTLLLGFTDGSRCANSPVDKLSVRKKSIQKNPSCLHVK
jgi:hypothetical protein